MSIAVRYEREGRGKGEGDEKGLSGKGGPGEWGRGGDMAEGAIISFLWGSSVNNGGTAFDCCDGLISVGRILIAEVE